MNNQPFTTAAREWLNHVEKKAKTTKKMRNGVLSFAIWLDAMMERQEQEEEAERDREN